MYGNVSLQLYLLQQFKENKSEELIRSLIKAFMNNEKKSRHNKMDEKSKWGHQILNTSN